VDQAQATVGDLEAVEAGIRAAQAAGSAHGPWRLANSPVLAFALPNVYFDSLGIPRLTGGQ